MQSFCASHKTVSSKNFVARVHSTAVYEPNCRQKYPTLHVGTSTFDLNHAYQVLLQSTNTYRSSLLQYFCLSINQPPCDTLYLIYLLKTLFGSVLLVIYFLDRGYGWTYFVWKKYYWRWSCGQYFLQMSYVQKFPESFQRYWTTLPFLLQNIFKIQKQ